MVVALSFADVDQDVVPVDGFDHDVIVDVMNELFAVKIALLVVGDVVEVALLEEDGPP